MASFYKVRGTRSAEQEEIAFKVRILVADRRRL